MWLAFVNAIKPSSVVFACTTMSDNAALNSLFREHNSPMVEKITICPSSKRRNNFSVDVHPMDITRVYCHSFPGICVIYVPAALPPITFFPQESYIRMSVVKLTSQFIGSVSSEFHFSAMGPTNITFSDSQPPTAVFSARRLETFQGKARPTHRLMYRHLLIEDIALFVAQHLPLRCIVSRYKIHTTRFVLQKTQSNTISASSPEDSPRQTSSACCCSQDPAPHRRRDAPSPPSPSGAAASHFETHSYLVVVLKQLRQQVQSIIRTLRAIRRLYKRTPWNTRIVFQRLLVYLRKIQPVAIEVLLQPLRAQHLADLHQLILVVLSLKQRLLPEQLAITSSMHHHQRP